jgi:hypothetical protein
MVKPLPYHYFNLFWHSVPLYGQTPYIGYTTPLPRSKKALPPLLNNFPAKIRGVGKGYHNV